MIDSMNRTIMDAMNVTGVQVYDYLDKSAEVPRIDTSATQGDVGILRVTTAAATKKMPATVVLVRSEATSHTHTLHPSGKCFWDSHESDGPTDLKLGTLTVPADSTALLMHQEHGGFEIMPGTYQVNRQREFAGEWAFVAD